MEDLNVVAGVAESDTVKYGFYTALSLHNFNKVAHECKQKKRTLESALLNEREDLSFICDFALSLSVVAVTS